MQPENRGDESPQTPVAVPASDQRLQRTTDPSSSHAASGDPDLRLELTSDGIRRIWALYSEENLSTRQEPRGGIGLGLEELRELLWRGRVSIAASTAAMLGIGLLYLVLATPLYAVTARLVVTDRESFGEGARHLGSTTQFVATQGEILASPRVVREAVDALPLSPVPADDPEQDPVLSVLESLTVTPITGTDVLALSYLSPDPEQGAQILASIIERYRQTIRRIEASDRVQDLEILEQRERELHQQLDELEREFAAGRAESEVIGEDDDAVSVQKQLLERLAGELVTARATRIGLENEMVALRKHGYAVSRETSQSREQLREAVWRAEAQLSNARAQYSEHPNMAVLEARVKSLRDLLGKMDGMEAEDLERKLGAARITEERLAELYAQEVQKAKTIDSAWVKQRQLQSHIDRVAEVHGATLAELREAQLTARGLEDGRSPVSVHVLEPPLAPVDSVWPSPIIVLGASVLFGGLLGLGLAALSLRTPGIQLAPRKSLELIGGDGGTVGQLTAGSASLGRALLRRGHGKEPSST